MNFDRAHHAVVSNGLLFYGGSADGVVRALSLIDGAERWSFATEGPVRFAPACFEDQVFVGSDDGLLYCLDAKTGKERWRVRGGPSDRRVLGNGRMISRWPVRGGPAIRDGILYFAAGIWPTDGIFLHAVNARTGERVWLNDGSGSLFLPQPHGGADAESGVSAQGHLVVTEELILVPTGRAVPAAFRRSDGTFLYYHLQKNGHAGGTKTMASGKLFFNSGMFFDAKSGAARGKNAYADIAAMGDDIVTVEKDTLSRFAWVLAEVVEKGKKQTVRRFEPQGRVALKAEGRCVIVCGSQAVVGYDGGLALVDVVAGKVLDTASVKGVVLGLAAANGRLYASTDDGAIHCFGERGAPETTHSPRPVEPPAEAEISPIIARAAEEIVARAKITEGFCLDVNCGDGALAEALAQRTTLRIVAVDEDLANVVAARRRLEQAGLLGQRVMVHHGTLDTVTYPRYFANLIVSGRSVTSDLKAVEGNEHARLVRPHGGVTCFGSPDAMKMTVRGPLAGEGTWTHQYADAGNSVCSNDEVRGPLGILWFDDPAQDLTQRHGRGPSPLYLKGRIFSLGLESLIAVDAYNGRRLWEVPFPGILTPYDGDHLMGVSGTQSPYCVVDDGVLVRTGSECVRLDPATGEERARYRAPLAPDGTQRPWGYLASTGNVVYGSLADPEHQVTYRYLDSGDLSKQLTESKTLFALDFQTGALLWRFDAAHSLRHNAIAVARGRVYVIDRPQAVFDRDKKAKAGPHPTGTLLALDAATGMVQWRQREAFGTLLSATSDGALVMGYQPTRFRLASEVGGRLAAFDLETGHPLWDRKATYASRPAINGETIYAQGGAFDLRSGEDREFDFSRSYGCGVLAAGKNLLVYRSATLGWYDLHGEKRTENFGGVRPGCWINAIPAGGLVLVPDGSTGCACSYQNKAWIALQPDDLRPPSVTPKGGAYRVPQRVVLNAEDDGAVVRYTLDGTLPNARSPVASDPLTVDRSLTLRTQAFAKNREPSRVRSVRFDIDETLLLTEVAQWDVWNVTGPDVESGPGNWTFGATIVQESNIFVKPAGMSAPTHPYYATMALYRQGKAWRDGTLRLQLRNDDDDGISVAFRARDERHHYLFHMDRQRGFRVLAVRDGDRYKVLAKDTVQFTQSAWHDVTITMEGSHLTVVVGNAAPLEAEDATHARGTIALGSWGSTGARFRSLRFEKR